MAASIMRCFILFPLLAVPLYRITCLVLQTPRVCCARDRAVHAGDVLFATSVIEPLRATIDIHGAGLVSFSKVKHGLTGGVYLVDAAVFLARGAGNTLLGNTHCVRARASSGGNFEAEVAMGHGGIAKGHRDATVVSNAFVVSLTRLA